jgi:hypothetical protein
MDWNMPYSIADYPQLQVSLLGEGGLCGPNLSLMMAAVGGLEVMTETGTYRLVLENNSKRTL